MSFDDRIRKSEVAVNAFDKYLELHGIEYAKSGYEDLKATNDFMKQVRLCNDGTATMLRYYPDRTIVGKKCTLVEIKNGTSIEKDAYDNYCSLAKIGHNVGIVFYYKNELLFCDTSELKFRSAVQWKKLKDNNIKMPIEDNIWYCPRQMERKDYMMYKQLYPIGSSTSFAYIDFENTNFTKLQSEYE